MLIPETCERGQFQRTARRVRERTGILLVRRNSSRASSDPSVDACTHTPRPDLSTEFMRSVKSDMMSSRSSSSSSSSPMTSSRDPAIAFSKSGATILIPSEALTSLW